MVNHRVVTLTGEDRPLVCAAVWAIRVAAQARMLRNVVVCASVVLLVSRATLPEVFEPYAETGFSMGSIRAMTVIASFLALVHDWSSRVRRDDMLAACSERLEVFDDAWRVQEA
jgi:hypothetical protein